MHLGKEERPSRVVAHAASVFSATACTPPCGRDRARFWRCANGAWEAGSTSDIGHGCPNPYGIGHPCPAFAYPLLSRRARTAGCECDCTRCVSAGDDRAARLVLGRDRRRGVLVLVDLQVDADVELRDAVVLVRREEGGDVRAGDWIS